MKKNFISLLVILIGISFCLKAQESLDVDKNFVFLNSGEFVYGTDVEYSSGTFRHSIIVDNKVYKLNDARFFKGLYHGERGLFAVSKGKGLFAPPVTGLIRSGEINLFETVVVTYTTDARSGMTTSSSKVYNFYNKGLGDIKKANYTNLSVYMKSHPPSMEHLLNFRRANNASNILMFTTVGLGTASLGTFLFLLKNVINENDQPFSVGIPFGLMGAALITGVTGKVIEMRKPHHMRLAVSTYNKQFE